MGEKGRKTVKCKFCGAEVNKEDAYLVEKYSKDGLRVYRSYYCSPDHYFKEASEKGYAKDIQNKTKNKAGELSGLISEKEWSSLIKEISDILKRYGYEKTYNCMLENESSILYYMRNKDFVSNYARRRYFAAMLRNMMEKYDPPKEKIKVVEEQDHVEENKYKPKTKRRGLEGLL